MHNKKISKVELLQNALKILDLSQFVTFKEIKARYRQLSRKYHPDICKDKDKMAEINSAYDILKSYIEDFRYSFDEDEIHKQYPENYLKDRFRF